MPHLFAGFFQLGYVTRDIDAAIVAYRQRFGPTEFLVTEPGPVNGAAPPTRRIALTYIDDVMTELIEPDPDQRTIYDHAVPAEVGDIRLHHLGYLVDDHEGTIEALRAGGYEVPFHGRTEALDFSYADTRTQLGHFSEFIRLDEGGKAFFGAVPRQWTQKDA